MSACGRPKVVRLDRFIPQRDSVETRTCVRGMAMKSKPASALALVAKGAAPPYRGRTGAMHATRLRSNDPPGTAYGPISNRAFACGDTVPLPRIRRSAEAFFALRHFIGRCAGHSARCTKKQSPSVSLNRNREVDVHRSLLLIALAVAMVAPVFGQSIVAPNRYATNTGNDTSGPLPAAVSL